MIFSKMRERVLDALASIWPYRLVRIALGALFLYGGVVKLLDPRAFARIISAYDLVPEPLLPVVAIGLPALEALAGLALILDIRGSLAVISGLFGLFLAASATILRDLTVDCGCFGAEDLARQAGLRQAFTGTWRLRDWWCRFSTFPGGSGRSPRGRRSAQVMNCRGPSDVRRVRIAVLACRALYRRVPRIPDRITTLRRKGVT